MVAEKHISISQPNGCHLYDGYLDFFLFWRSKYLRMFSALRFVFLVVNDKKVTVAFSCAKMIDADLENMPQLKAKRCLVFSWIQLTLKIEWKSLQRYKYVWCSFNTFVEIQMKSIYLCGWLCTTENCSRSFPRWISYGIAFSSIKMWQMTGMHRTHIHTRSDWLEDIYHFSFLRLSPI